MQIPENNIIRSHVCLCVLHTRSQERDAGLKCVRQIGLGRLPTFANFTTVRQVTTAETNTPRILWQRVGWDESRIRHIPSHE